MIHTCLQLSHLNQQICPEHFLLSLRLHPLLSGWFTARQRSIFTLVSKQSPTNKRYVAKLLIDIAGRRRRVSQTNWERYLYEEYGVRMISEPVVKYRPNELSATLTEDLGIENIYWTSQCLSGQETVFCTMKIWTEIHSAHVSWMRPNNNLAGHSYCFHLIRWHHKCPTRRCFETKIQTLIHTALRVQ